MYINFITNYKRIPAFTVILVFQMGRRSHSHSPVKGRSERQRRSRDRDRQDRHRYERDRKYSRGNGNRRSASKDQYVRERERDRGRHGRRDSPIREQRYSHRGKAKRWGRNWERDYSSDDDHQNREHHRGRDSDRARADDRSRERHRRYLSDYDREQRLRDRSVDEDEDGNESHNRRRRPSDSSSDRDAERLRKKGERHSSKLSHSDRHQERRERKSSTEESDSGSEEEPEVSCVKVKVEPDSDDSSKSKSKKQFPGQQKEKLRDSPFGRGNENEKMEVITSRKESDPESKIIKKEKSDKKDKNSEPLQKDIEQRVEKHEGKRKRSDSNEIDSESSDKGAHLDKGHKKLQDIPKESHSEKERKSRKKENSSSESKSEDSEDENSEEKEIKKGKKNNEKSDSGSESHVRGKKDGPHEKLVERKGNSLDDDLHSHEQLQEKRAERSRIDISDNEARGRKEVEEKGNDNEGPQQQEKSSTVKNKGDGSSEDSSSSESDHKEKHKKHLEKKGRMSEDEKRIKEKDEKKDNRQSDSEKESSAKARRSRKSDTDSDHEGSSENSQKKTKKQRKVKKKKHSEKRSRKKTGSSSSSSSDECDKVVRKSTSPGIYDSNDETTEQELLRKKKQLEEQLKIEEEIRMRSENLEKEREAARARKYKAMKQKENDSDIEEDSHKKKNKTKNKKSRSRSRSQSASSHDLKADDKRENKSKKNRSGKKSRPHSSDEDGSDNDRSRRSKGRESEEPQIGGRYWGGEHSAETTRQMKAKQTKSSDTYWNKYADKLGIQIENPRYRDYGSERGRDKEGGRRREEWSSSSDRKRRANSEDDERRDSKKRKDVVGGDNKENSTSDPPAKPLIQKPVVDPLTLKTGGAYIPPAKLKMMQAQITDKSTVQFQRLAWEALKKSINGLVNKVNVSNIGIIVRELLKENIIRGRGILCRALMQAQSFSPTFTHVYSAMVAILNSKFPQIGELLLKRLVIQLRRGVRRNDKNICTSSCRFIAHLINQQVAHEVVALEILTLLLEKAKDLSDESEVGDKSRNNSCELAILFLTECGMKLSEVTPRGMNIIFETLRHILHEGKLEQRVTYMIEVIFAVRKDGFKDHASVPEELDLVEEDDQYTHIVELDGKMEGEDILNVFKHDPEYEENEEKYKEIRTGILGDGSDDSSSEGGSDSGSDSDDEESDDEEEKAESQIIIDQTETNMVAFRRTVYLTIQSSLDVDECAHKLLKGEIKPGWESELCNMILDCCAQQRTYIKFYGLLAQRFCLISKVYQEPFEQIFKEVYDTCHRLETEKLRNVARLFAHLLFSDAISWEVLNHVHLNEDETTSSSRVFVKILFQVSWKNFIMEYNHRYECHFSQNDLAL